MYTPKDTLNCNNMHLLHTVLNFVHSCTYGKHSISLLTLSFARGHLSFARATLEGQHTFLEAEIPGCCAVKFYFKWKCS